jgi:predicted nucleic acid-binding Zn ribbon protein
MERADRYGQLANILIANPSNAEALAEITNPDTVFTRLEALTQEFAQNEDAIRISFALAQTNTTRCLVCNQTMEPGDLGRYCSADCYQQQGNEIRDDDIGADGYPICPNCQNEHNNYDNDQLPYCSSDCQYAHQHCGICRKKLPVDEQGFMYCAGACQEEAHRRQGNGD